MKIRTLSRRDFLCQSMGALAVSACPLLLRPRALSAGVSYSREAMFYKQLADNKVQCEICPNDCILSNYQRSKCLVKEPRNNKLYSLVYDYPNVILTEPIEKGPIYHIRPGSKLLAIATAGCNLSCKYCQNWQLALSRPDDKQKFHVTPEQAVQKAREQDCRGLVFTYNEPIVNYEYVREASVLSRQAGMMNIMVTAGFIHERPMKELAVPFDGFIVGLKGFNEKYYKDIVNGKLQPVLDTLVLLRREKKWLEVINLIVPGLNDDMAEIRQMCGWIRKNLGKDVPLHFAKFSPNYKLANLPPTPQVTLEKAREIGLDAGMKFVYINNLPGHEGNNTYCSKCGKMLIRRLGYSVLEIALQDGKCSYCHTRIPGMWT